MNDLLGGLGKFLSMNNQMRNPVTPQMASTAQSPNILFQAIGAAMRGEDPHVFLQNLAQQHPQLRQYDFSNLQETAKNVCQQNGVDMQQAINQLDNITSSVIQSPQK